MKQLLVCLLMGCLLSSPAWGAGPGITLEEFLQKLEKAEPWTREKVEALLGIKLSERGGGGGRGGHWAHGQFVFAEGLIVKDIGLEVSRISGKTNILANRGQTPISLLIGVCPRFQRQKLQEFRQKQTGKVMGMELPGV